MERPAVAPPPDDSDRLVQLAEARAQAGAHGEAARLFDEVARRPDAPSADRALVGLTRLLVRSEYDARDYRRAYLVVQRLLHEHPGSRYAAEARGWRDLLAAYLALGEELDQRRLEREWLLLELEHRTQELERLGRLDLELEHRTRELERRTRELERLKRLDLELERRTKELERRTQELEQLKRLDLELEQRRKP
jgi:hypothetical protein